MTLKYLSITYIVTAVVFLLLAGLAGALGGMAILNGGMLGAIPGSMFISMHLSLGHLGWVIMALIGLYLGLCYVTSTEINYGFRWFQNIYWVYLLGLITSVVFIAFGYSNEARYGETNLPFALLMMATLATFIILIINLFKQTKNTREIAIYYFIISMIFIALYFGVITLPLDGVAFSIALNLSTHLLFDGMMLAIMGLSIYILPRIVGRPLYSEMLAIIQLWMVLMMVLLTGSRHLVRLGIMTGPTEFWAFFYNSLAVAFICVYFANLYLTIRGAKPTENKFSFWALILSNIYLGIVAFQGLGFLYLVIFKGEGAPKMLVTLHAHFALFGFVTLGVVGALFYFLPKLINGFKISHRLSQGIFYTLNGGMLLSFTSTSLKNITPAEAHFADHLTAEMLETYYLSSQYIGDSLLLVASVLIGWAVVTNIVGSKLPIKRMATVMLLALGIILGNWWPAPFTTTLAQAEGPIVAVANEGDGTISVLNGATGKVIRVIKTEGNPHNVNFDPLGRFLWVTDHSEAGRILGYSLENFKKVAEIPLAGAGGHIVPSYDGRFLYVSVEGADRIVIVETETFQVVSEFITEGMPHGLVINPAESLLLVPNMMSDSVSVIEIETGRILAIVPVDTGTIDKISFDLIGKLIFHHGHDGSIFPGHDINNGESMTMPVAMGISTAGDKAYVSLAGSDQVAEIDLDTFQVTRVVNLPGRREIGPIQLPTHPNGRYLYVPSMSEGKVFKIDLENFRFAGEVQTGAGAHGIAFSHGGRYAYVTNTYENTVACIDTFTDEIVFVEAVGLAPNGVTVLNGKNQGW